jgi:hypothetical protein
MARETLHRLVDELPEEEVGTAGRVLAALAAADPLARRLAEAPYSEEPETEEERRALEEARAESDRGEGVPHEEAMRQLGLR